MAEDWFEVTDLGIDGVVWLVVQVALINEAIASDEPERVIELIDEIRERGFTTQAGRLAESLYDAGFTEWARRVNTARLSRYN